MKKQSVLFLCMHNSARSQMAEGLLRTNYGINYEAYSAGVVPTIVNPYAIEVMKEIGIDLSSHRSKSIEEYRGRIFDYVITVCDQAKENCPFFPGRIIFHRGFEDPTKFEGNIEDTLTIYRRVRDDIKTWIIDFFGSSQKKNKMTNFIVKIDPVKK